MNGWRFSTTGCRVAMWYKARPLAGLGGRRDLRNVMIPMWFRVGSGCMKRPRANDLEGPRGSSSPSRTRSCPSGCRSWWVGDGQAEAICQIPRTMKIVYTQRCSFGPERDNQLSYTRTIQRRRRGLKRSRGCLGFHRNVARLLRCSTSITRLDASLGDASLGYASLGYASLGYASLGDASLGDASLGDEPRRDEM